MVTTMSSSPSSSSDDEESSSSSSSSTTRTVHHKNDSSSSPSRVSKRQYDDGDENDYARFCSIFKNVDDKNDRLHHPLEYRDDLVTRVSSFLGWSAVAVNCDGSKVLVGGKISNPKDYEFSSNTTTSTSTTSSSSSSSSSSHHNLHHPQKKPAVHLYYDGRHGTQIKTLHDPSSSSSSSSSFGRAVAMNANGKRLLIASGGDGKDDENVVYLMDDRGHWLHTFTMPQDVQEERDTGSSGFGSSLAISPDGTIIAIGAPIMIGTAATMITTSKDAANDDSSSSSFSALRFNAGGVFLYNDRGELLHHLTSPNHHVAPEFGHAIALNDDGSHIAIGSPGEEFIGSKSNAIVYGAIDGSAETTGSSGVHGDSGGNGSGTHTNDNHNLSSWFGAAYIYDVKTGAYRKKFISSSYEVASSLTNHQRFGTSIDLSKDFLVVGATATNYSIAGDGDDNDANAGTTTTTTGGVVFVYDAHQTGPGVLMHRIATNPPPPPFKADDEDDTTSQKIIQQEQYLSFGTFVSLGGQDQLLVGDGHGSVYYYEDLGGFRDGGSFYGQQQQQQQSEKRPDHLTPKYQHHYYYNNTIKNNDNNDETNMAITTTRAKLPLVLSGNGRVGIVIGAPPLNIIPTWLQQEQHQHHNMMSTYKLCFFVGSTAATTAVSSCPAIGATTTTTTTTTETYYTPWFSWTYWSSWDSWSGKSIAIVTITSIILLVICDWRRRKQANRLERLVQEYRSATAATTSRTTATTTANHNEERGGGGGEIELGELDHHHHHHPRNMNSSSSSSSSSSIGWSWSRLSLSPSYMLVETTNIDDE